jgi:hypothetical protein
MIYTTYEMIQDCRSNRAEGWSYFVFNYVPVIRRILAHYAQGPAAPEAASVVARLRNSLFSTLQPLPERRFVAELRQKVLADLPSPEPAVPLDLETVSTALADLTTTEKHIAWLESMRYGAPESAALLRMSPETVERIRARSADLLRAACNSWNRAALADNGLALGRAAAAAGAADCVSARMFLDVLDGRATWAGREQLEAHQNRCPHCIDHYCRLLEANELGRGNRALTKEEAREFLA